MQLVMHYLARITVLVSLASYTGCGSTQIPVGPLDDSGTPASSGPTGGSSSPAGYNAFLYVPNGQLSSVSAYSIDPGTGQLAALGAFPTGAQPFSVRGTSSGRFLLVAERGISKLSSYVIGGKTGELTLLGSLTTAANPVHVALSPDEQAVFVVGSATIFAHTFDPTTGGLTAGTVVANVGSPLAVTVDGFAFFNSAGSSMTTNTWDNFLNLSPVGSAATPSGAGQVFVPAAHPSGSAAYVTGANVTAGTGGGLAAYSINRSSGALSRISSHVYTGSTNPGSVTVRPDGRFLYTTDSYSMQVCAYPLNQTTFDIQYASVTCYFPGVPWSSIVFDPFGQSSYAYITTYNGDVVLVAQVDPASGALTQIQSLPTAGVYNFDIATVRAPYY